MQLQMQCNKNFVSMKIPVESTSPNGRRRYLRARARFLRRRSARTWRCRSSAVCRGASNWEQRRWLRRERWCWRPELRPCWARGTTTCTGSEEASLSGSIRPPSCQGWRKRPHLHIRINRSVFSDWMIIYYHLLFFYSRSIPITLLVVPPGQPTVDRHGPLFPALDTNKTLYFCTASVMTSQILLKNKQSHVNSVMFLNTRWRPEIVDKN